MPDHIICAQCRHENPATERFCGQCGAALAADVPAPSAGATAPSIDVAPNRARSGHRAAIVVACLAVAILAVGAAAIMLMQRGGSGENGATSTAQFATCSEADATGFGSFRTSDTGAGDFDSATGRLGSWYRQLDSAGASLNAASRSTIARPPR